MRRLKLYPRTPQAAVGLEAPIPIDHNCERCSFSQGPLKSRCMNPEGAPNGLYLLAEMPGVVEDAQGRPFAGNSGQALRRLVKQYWTGPVAFDNAVRCKPNADVKDKHIEACRAYGAQVIRDVNPQRIIALGNAAVYSLLGRRAPIMSVRRGYSWYLNDDGEYIPIFFAVNPAAATRNRFVWNAFESDLRWALTCKIPEPQYRGETVLIVSYHDAINASRALEGAKEITYDVETVGRMGNPTSLEYAKAKQVLAHVQGRALGSFGVESVTLLGDTDTAYTWTREALQNEGAVWCLRDLLQKKAVVTQNGKYDDRAMLAYAGIDVRKVAGDTRLLRKLLDFESAASLEVLSELVGLGGHKAEAQEKLDTICKELRYQANPPSGFTPTGKQRKVRPPAFRMVPTDLDAIREGEEPMAFAFRYLDAETLYRYNARDVFSTRAVYRVLKEQLRKEPQIERVWTRIVKDASVAVRWIEHWGFAVDRGAMQNTAQFCKSRVVIATQKLNKYGSVNPASPKQLQEFLFKTLKLKPLKQTDSGQLSTDAETLEHLKGQHPAVECILDIRRYSKLDGTYATGMQVHIREDGRIHASYLLDGAASGRLSSSDPNMQNLPRADSPEGKMVRDCFIAPKDFVIIEADQSQIELRVAAMLSQDKTMIGDYVKGIDIHGNNARECCEVVWGIKRDKWDKMTKEERSPYRSQIKTTTFGKLYGKTDAGLAAEFNCDVKVIKEINKRIWGRYARLARWIQERVEYSQRTGVAWTWWDGQDARRRQIWMIADHDKERAAHAERQSYNGPIQGTAADFTTSSLWPIVSYFLNEGLPAKVIATVHDSIVVEAHKTVIDEVTQHMKKVMTGWPSMGVPLVAEFKMGDRWGSMSELKV